MIFPSQGKATEFFINARFQTSAPRNFDNLCQQYKWLCATTGRNHLLGFESLSVIRIINTRVNHSTPEISDMEQYGVEDFWALPTLRGGDCEDIAMLKKKQLVALGFAPETLSIAAVLTRDGQNHAVLIARMSFGDYAIDNLTDRILLWSDTGYTYLRVQNFENPEKWDAVFEGGALAKATAKIKR